VTELLSGFWLDKTHRYLCTLRTTVLASTVITGGLIFIVPKGNYVLCAIAISCSGFAIGPIMPVGFDFGVQLTHPIQPALVNGMLQMAEQISEFLLSTTLVGLSAYNPQWAFMTLFGVCVIASVTSMFVREDLRIYEIELRDKRKEGNKSENKFLDSDE
jgi:MFS family permease